MNQDQKPIVFISYSHDSKEHKQWVNELAIQLTEKGIDVKFDQWDVEPGDELSVFMRKSISESNRVLVICTDEYIRKAEEGIGGVGYEGLVLHSQLFKDIGTNKFIPIIRQSSSEQLTPNFLETRKYIDARSGKISNDDFIGLLKTIHKIPSSKPPIGQSPFSSIQNSLQETQELVPITEGTLAPQEAYSKGIELIRRQDTLGWLDISKKASRNIPQNLLKWREKHNSIMQKRNIESQVESLYEAINVIAPALSLALLGVESADNQFSNQKSLFTKFYNPIGWVQSGLTSVVTIPKFLGFIYQALHGSICLLTGQLSLALEFAEMSVSYSSRSTERAQIWQNPSLIGYPDSLEHMDPWSFLLSLHGHFSWLANFFEDEEEYRTCLSSYYLLLHLFEFGFNATNRDLKSFSDHVHLHVPLFFSFETDTRQRRSIDLLASHPRELRKLWERFRLKPDQLRELWPYWKNRTEEQIMSNLRRPYLVNYVYSSIYDIL